MRRLWPFYRAGWAPTKGSWLDDADIKRKGWLFIWVGPWIIGWGWDK